MVAELKIRFSTGNLVAEGKEISHVAVSFSQGPRRLGAVERTGLSTFVPARASPGSNVVGVVKTVRCSSSSVSGLQTGIVSLTFV